MPTNPTNPPKQWIDLNDMGKCELCRNRLICKSVDQMTTIKTNLNKILSDNNLEVLELGLKCTFFAKDLPVVSTEQKIYNEVTR
ncbi:MAG: hypothetical protein ACRDA4_10575 [Filifactoraceae bacterium]